MEAKENTIKKDMTLLEAVERIVMLSRDSKLSMEFMKSAEIEIKYLAKQYGITMVQAVLFSVCIQVGPCHISYYSLGEHLNLGKISMLKYASDIDALVNRKLLCCTDHKGEDDYRIPSEVTRTLKRNVAYVKPSYKGLDCVGIFGVINQLFFDLEKNNLSIHGLQDELEILLKDNEQVSFAKEVLKYDLCRSDLFLLIFFCHKYANENEESVGNWELKHLFEDFSSFCLDRKNLIAGKHYLQEKKILEFECDGGIVDVETYRLTGGAKKTLLAELGLSNSNKEITGVLDSRKLPYKQMFFTPYTQRQFDKLSHFLVEDNFKQIQERMKAKGFRKGFACLFYGSPGTGKTESAYQLARQTGRNIMVVDIAGLRDRFVGETEKNMKAVFDRYRDSVKISNIYPILLFNEADAIICKRNSEAERAVDKMENSLLNILLQEMEQLDGIMIATTNLVENMDKAFERRFLYKIKFEKPSIEVRTKIWHSMLPELNESDVQTLASKYDFSGGQIENVARHYSIDTILHDQGEDVLATLIQHCDSERLDVKNSSRIGF